MREDVRDSKRQKIGAIDRQLNGKVMIYNKIGAKIGEIRPSGHQLIAYDKAGRKMGYWDERNDTTFEPNSGRKISKGNVLVEMYFQE